jgi:6,7-dimethyl-8-ribityllumazine synthase
MAVMQVLEGRVCPPPSGGNITIIVARFNKTITQRLLDGALAKLRQHNVYEDDIRVVWVPGAYELPFIADYFAHDPQCLAIICLGAVIKGETSHDQHINRFVSTELGKIAAQYSKPVIFGVLTCDTIEQANARSGITEGEKDKTINPAPGNKGAEAAEAALEMIDLFEDLPSYEFEFPPHDILSHLLSEMQGDGNTEYGNDGDFFPLPRKTQTRKTTTRKQQSKKAPPKKGKGKGKGK